MLKIEDVEAVRISYIDNQGITRRITLTDEVELRVDKEDEVYIEESSDGFHMIYTLLNIRDGGIRQVYIDDINKDFFIDVTIEKFKSTIAYLNKGGDRNIIDFLTK